MILQECAETEVERVRDEFQEQGREDESSMIT